MKRLGRWAFNILAGVSLLLFLATTLLWMRSYWRLDRFLVEQDRRSAISSCWGIISVYQRWEAMGQDADLRVLPGGGWEPATFVLRPISSRPVVKWEVERARRFLDSEPFEWRNGWGDMEGGVFIVANYYRGFNIPHWALAAAALLFPAIATRRYWVRWRRLSRGHCPVCGYDLRATPDRCPECGHIPNTPPPAK